MFGLTSKSIEKINCKSKLTMPKNGLDTRKSLMALRSASVTGKNGDKKQGNRELSKDREQQS